ncbi:MAG: DUF4091 domain-containing protein [Thermoguttaceae bacterium]|jgi:hypothetical protein|nr:DUF4091 domain-containing protein [Thermoguttaceae bacterium]
MTTLRFYATLAAVLVSVFALLGADAEGNEKPFSLYPASDAVRVFEDGYAWSAGGAEEIRVFGLQSEVLSAQCAVRAHSNIDALTVSVGPLQHAGGSASIAKEHVQWRFVESISIEENTPKLRKSDLVRPAPARFPDCLSEQRQTSVAEDSLKAIYLTLRIPATAEPGEYRGAVTVAAGEVEQSLPVVLQVYPLALPHDRNLLATLWFSTGRFEQHHGIDPADQEQLDNMLRVYAENMADHRLNVFRVPLELIGWTLSVDGTLRCDFERFDHRAQIFWDTGCMSAMETGFVARHGEGGWSSTEIALRDFSVKDEATGKTRRMAGEEFLPLFLPMLVDHLRQKEWLDKTLFHICDEPANHNILLWRDVSDFVHRHAPELRRIDAIETTHFRDRLEVWVPKLDHLATWQEAYEAAQREGYELWLYTVGIYQEGSLPNKTVDVALIETRLLHWLNYRYRLAGYLHWGYNAWTDDPLGAPGKHRGDGWHVYPKPGGLLDSLRSEQMRAGIQDYECLRLLEDKIAELRDELSPRAADLIDPARRGVEIASQVVRTYTDFSRDPDVLYAARRQAIEEACDLARAPRAILQTNPPEHSVIANNASVDVHGWAEPGATITVNGRETPVADDGLFFAQARAAKDGTITVVIDGGETKKQFVRHFRLQFDPESL